MTEYEAVIGLEVHVQLSTRSKLFCACSSEYGARPNSQVCPVCLGHPGVLPVVNKLAVELGVRAALAVGADVKRLSTWARKNYFYPDLPKGYQITQFDQPLAEGGFVEIESKNTSRRIPIARMHLEEDAGKSKHPEQAGDTSTLVDLNRCGTPLLEIVCEPEIRTPKEAHAYLDALKQILEYCEVSDCDMEKGNLRCDANISVRSAGEEGLGTKTEIKNLNSFRAVERALAAEVDRQTTLLKDGRTIEQATLLWDERTGDTQLMRGKEESPDYRYFPEPDLPPLVLEDGWIGEIQSRIPESPAARRQRFVSMFGIRPYDARVLTASRGLSDYYDAIASRVPDAQTAANVITTELLGLLHDRGLDIAACPVSPGDLTALLNMRSEGVLSGPLAKQVLVAMVESGKTAEEVIEKHGWSPVDDKVQLDSWVREMIEANPDAVAAYLGGKESLLQFFIGQVMKRSQGRADPVKVAEILRQALAGERA
ncbi:Asp-tRNA(Asn)/Glu-tRNA(Gln) amidotransferase subunit GatB [Candidatus Eisenbacteria bacterium]|uniref:Aspartyl/glutamyl-tRNA(Asn/Gln) amidotransferase subunit B n=1 Tax=Eiseniibacteriota bacterium TaxID=2212470 RepID=A0ABV6YJB0_UNCEI